MSQHVQSEKQSQIQPQILRLTDVQVVTGLKRSSIYLYMSQGRFPRNIKIGLRSSGWLYDEIQDWITQRIEDAKILQSMKHKY
jgi:prophage regulatory protein